MTNYIKFWEKAKKKGRTKYSIIQGVIFASVVTLIKDRNLIWDSMTGETNELLEILINFTWLFLGATIGYYFIIWWWKEKMYDKEKVKLATTKNIVHFADSAKNEDGSIEEIS